MTSTFKQINASEQIIDGTITASLLSSNAAVLTVSSDSNPNLTGNVQLISGTSISLSQSGNTITVNSTGSGGTPAGPTDAIQFNNSGSFGGSNQLIFSSSGFIGPVITAGGSTEAGVEIFGDGRKSVFYGSNDQSVAYANLMVETDNNLYITTFASSTIFLNPNQVLAAQFDNSTNAGDTRMLLWDVNIGSLQRVSVGAADSGGTGFKVLRIPN